MFHYIPGLGQKASAIRLNGFSKPMSKLVQFPIFLHVLIASLNGMSRSDSFETWQDNRLIYLNGIMCRVQVWWPWAFYQMRKIAGCACARNAGNVSPSPRVSDPDMHHGTCVTHVQWCMPGSITSVKFFPLKSVAGKTFPTFPTHVQPVILRICKRSIATVTIWHPVM